VVGERGLKEGKLEYQGRRDQASTPVAVDELFAFVQARLCAR
jgi:prolyl-tRNA synthetase